METWKRDYGVLRQGDERWKRQAGRIMTLVVERSVVDKLKWEGRAGRFRLTRLFPTKFQAMSAVEKMAARLLQEALEDLA